MNNKISQTQKSMQLQLVTLLLRDVSIIIAIRALQWDLLHTLVNIIKLVLHEQRVCLRESTHWLFLANPSALGQATVC